MSTPAIRAESAHVLQPSPPTKPATLKRLPILAAAIPGEAGLILLGDSLAASWPAADLPGPAFNFGLPGERIQNTLWRLATLDTGHLRPRRAVLLLGTNNLGDGDPPAAIADGLIEVVRAMQRLWGAPAITAVTVPRRGESPGFREAERRELNQRLSLRATSLTDVTVLDVDAALEPGQDGRGPSLGPDLLHLSPAGYHRLGQALARHFSQQPA